MIRCTHNSWDKAGRIDNISLPRGLVSAEIIDENLELEEDHRRLFYVALTRAKKMVHLSHARFRSEQNKVREDLPSIFLNEIPENLLQKNLEVSRTDQELTELESLFLLSPEPSFNADEESFLKTLVNRVILSPTAINNYLTCPRKFFYQNLIRLPQARSKSAAMGSAIHAALDRYFKEYHRKKIKPAKEFLTLNFQSSLQRELLTEKDYKEKLEIGMNILNDYFDAFSEQFSADTVTEFDFKRDGINIDGIPITGKIDKIEPLENGLAVTDFKTGNADGGMQKLTHGNDYWRQLVFYKLLCDRSPQFKRQFQDRPMTVAKIEFLEKSRSKGQFLCPSVNISAADQTEVIANIKFVHDQIAQLNFEKIDKSEPCNHCPFYDLCWKK